MLIELQRARESFRSNTTQRNGNLDHPNNTYSNVYSLKTFHMNHFVYFILLLSFQKAFTQIGSISGQFCIGSTESEFPIKEAFMDNGNRIVLLVSNSPAIADKTENCRGDYDFWVLCINQNDQIVWQKTIGGNDFDNPSGLLITEDQSIYICGATLSTPSFEQTNDLFGSWDAWLIKMNNTGDIIWNKNYGGTASDGFNDLIELPSGNIFIFGTSASDVSGNKTSSNYGANDLWSLKLNTNGTILNDWSIGGAEFEVRPYIIQTAPNRIKLVANSSSDVSGLKTEPSFGYSDIWVLDLDTNCNILQQKTIGGSDLDTPTDLLWSHDGKLLILAESWSNQSGLKTENAYGLMDTWILKLDDDLTIMQQKTVGSDLQDYASQFIEWPNGNLCVLATSDSNPNQYKSAPNMGGTDIWMYALDPNFNLLADKTIGTMLDETSTSLTLSPNLSDIQVLAASSGGVSFYKTCPSNGSYDFWGLTLNSTLQINDIQTNKTTKVYPNPSQNLITIEHTAADQISELLLLDYSGKLIKEFDPKNSILNLTDLSPGIYFLQFSTEQGNFCEKIRLE